MASQQKIKDETTTIPILKITSMRPTNTWKGSPTHQSLEKGESKDNEILQYNNQRAKIRQW